MQFLKPVIGSSFYTQNCWLHLVTSMVRRLTVNSVISETSHWFQFLHSKLLTASSNEHGNSIDYNLSTWLVTVSFLIMLALLIPGRESVTSENIDVYLTPLIEELLELWKGVPAIDVSEEPSRQHFKLRALLLWCIHDFPAYGLTSGQVTKGYRACTECGPDVTTRRSKALGKNVYLGHRRYLSRWHPYRRLKHSFDGQQEYRPPPPILTGCDIKGYAEERLSFLQKSQERRGGGEGDPIHRTGVKRLSALYLLPYWQVLSAVTSSSNYN